jgi:hypothetical protein
MKEQRRLAGIKSGQARKQRLIEQPLNNRSTTVEQPLNENEQSKVKKRKEKESKVNKIKYADLVLLEEREYDNLIEKLGQVKTSRAIEILDNYKGSSGKTYTSDYKAILSWVVDRINKESTGTKSGLDNLAQIYASLGGQNE